MIFSSYQRTGAAFRYFAFNGVMAAFALLAVQDLARQAVALAPDTRLSAPPGPSRVDLFKQGEAAAAKAPQVPVARVIVAQMVPDMPVQVLAVRLDQAESLKAKPIKLKRKAAVRTAKATVKIKKGPAVPQGDLPTIAVQIETGSLDVASMTRTSKVAMLEESSRDITNRTLGVLVALKY